MSGESWLRWGIVREREVVPVATDAEAVRGIALTAKLDLAPAQRTEEALMQDTLQRTLGDSPRTLEAPDLSDERLMARLQSEDPDALDVLFSRHSRLVFSIAFRILHDAGEAEEVVQDSFLYVYRKALSFEPSKGSAKVWIIQVAYSRARDRKARLLRRVFYLRTDIESVGLSDTLVGQPDIEREIDAKIEFDRLQCAFEDLTEIQRETLKLFYRGIYLTPPTPRCSVWGHGRGLSEDVAGVGAAFLHRGILC